MYEHPTPQRWPRPRWRALYTIVGLAAVAVAMTRAALPASLPRSLALLAIPLATVVAVVVWMATNRAALDLTAWCACAGSTVRVRVVGAPVRPPRADTARGTSPAERTTLRV